MMDFSKIENEDEFIRAVAEDCLSTMSDEDKEYIRNHPDTGEYHFGYALYIRNHYIHGKKLAISCYDPDSLSGDIMSGIFSILLPDEYEFGDRFTKWVYDLPGFVAIRNEYIRVHGESPVGIVRRYRDEYNERLKPIEQEREERWKEADIIFDDNSEELIAKELEDLMDDPFAKSILKDKSEESLRSIAMALAHSSVMDELTDDLFEKRLEISKDIDARLIRELAEDAWQTDKVRKKAAEYGTDSAEMERVISELKNWLFKHYEFVPLRMAFIKFRDIVGEPDYTDYKNEFLQIIKQNWRLERVMDKSWLVDEDIARAVRHDT